MVMMALATVGCLQNPLSRRGNCSDQQIWTYPVNVSGELSANRKLEMSVRISSPSDTLSLVDGVRESSSAYYTLQGGCATLLCLKRRSHVLTYIINRPLANTVK